MRSMSNGACSRSVARLLYVAGALGATACSGATGDATTPTNGATSPNANLSSGTLGEKYFPLKDGHIYQYETLRLGNGPPDKGMLPVRVKRTSATTGELKKGGTPQTFQLSELGVQTQTKSGAPAFVLKMPIDPSTTWLGPLGGKTRYDAQNQSVDSRAGHFDGCVRTIEERGGDAPLRVATVFCPDVGIVTLEVQSGAAVERAELVYYGPQIEIGPDGLKRVE